MIKFVIDSYAFVEFFGGNQKFKAYINQDNSVTTKWNMAEVYYATLKNQNEELAELYYDSITLFEYLPSDELIKNAMKKRLELKKSGRDISYADAIGYQLAVELKAKFVTGDNEFKDLENVIFIK